MKFSLGNFRKREECCKCSFQFWLTLLEDKRGALVADYVYMLNLQKPEVEAERVMYQRQLRTDDSETQSV